MAPATASSLFCRHVVGMKIGESVSHMTTGNASFIGQPGMGMSEFTWEHDMHVTLFFWATHPVSGPVVRTA